MSLFVAMVLGAGVYTKGNRDPGRRRGDHWKGEAQTEQRDN